MNVKLTTIVFLSLFLCSCALKDDLPSEWGSLNSDCSDVIALLDNKGASSSEYGESWLSVLLVPAAEFSHRADQIKISVNSSENRLDIELLSNSEIVEKLSVSSKEFKGCKDGGFVVARSAVVNSGGALAKEWWEFTLYFATDSLIVSKKKGAIGTLFFVPIAGTETQWLRFEKA
ncbi:hypothetical protein [Alteromonas lipotrueae]|uniref:hypothetical protein n=1 Tax=Alteromonas lipotrueae TaxID=2803814 RepID=UPI001C458209|nr:hypothetical protein [Alteromonas lipotrueae]